MLVRWSLCLDEVVVIPRHYCHIDAYPGIPVWLDVSALNPDEELCECREPSEQKGNAWKEFGVMQPASAASGLGLGSARRRGEARNPTGQGTRPSKQDFGRWNGRVSRLIAMMFRAG